MRNVDSHNRERARQNHTSSELHAQSVPYHGEKTPHKAAMSKAKRRHQRLKVFYLLTFLFVISAAVVLSLTVLFKIDAIDVIGTTRYSSNEIVKASKIKIGDNLFLAKTSQAIENIQQQLPYLGKITISRKLPAKIEITVSELAASGVIRENNKNIIIDSNQKVLEISDSSPKNCAIINGLKIKTAELGKPIVYQDKTIQKLFEKIQQALTHNKLDKITKIDISNPYKIFVEYDARITLSLGLEDNLDYKMSFAKRIIDSGKINSTQKGTLNLSIASQNDKAYFEEDNGILSSDKPSSSSNSTTSSSKTADSSSSNSKVR